MLKAYQQELHAQRAIRPTDVPGNAALSTPDKSIKGKIVQGALTTPDGVTYQFTSEAGAMLYVKNTQTGELFSYIMSPKLAANAAGQPTILPLNTDKGADVIVHGFKLENEGQSAVEIEFTAVNSKKSESVVSSLGAGDALLLISGVLPWDRHGYPHALCCVSCGTYQVCGQTVNSSCGSCGGSGSGVQHNDGPP